jgi:hypothetical protein
MIEKRVPVFVEEVSHGNKDKIAMAQSIIGLMSLGLVRFPTFAPWWKRAEYQLLKFPNGKNDDFVTFISLLGRGINSMFGMKKPTVTKAFVPQSGLHITMGELKQVELRRSRLKMLALTND